MSISNLYMLGPVVVAAGQINQIQDYQPDAGIEELVHFADGQVDYAVRRGHDAVAEAGLRDDRASRGRWDRRLQRLRDRRGGRLLLPEDRRRRHAQRRGDEPEVTGTKGILVPTSIECEDKQPAKLNFSLVLISSDGTTAPIAFAASQTMPSITATGPGVRQRPDLGQRHARGRRQETRVDFGIQLIVEHGSGEGYPTFVGIQRRQPTVTFKTTDVTTFGQHRRIRRPGRDRQPGLPPQGRPERAARRRRDGPAHQGVDRRRPALHAHLRRRRRGGPADDRGRLRPTWDGTNDVLAISTASAIT
jgi:hypothetical protein